MQIVKTVLYYSSNTVEKGNILSTLMTVVGETDETFTLKDNNGYSEDIKKDFKGKFNIEETTLYNLKVSLYKKIRDGDDIADIFYKNEKNIKRKALQYIKETVLMYRELYKNIYKIVDRFDIKKIYDKDEIAEWGKLGARNECV